MSIILAAVAFLYSTGCVLYEEYGPHSLPDLCMIPIAPGIWVGMAVHSSITSTMWVCYAAGIGTMTVIGAVLGEVFEYFSGGRRGD